MLHGETEGEEIEVPDNALSGIKIPDKCLWPDSSEKLILLDSILSNSSSPDVSFHTC